MRDCNNVENDAIAGDNAGSYTKPEPSFSRPITPIRCPPPTHTLDHPMSCEDGNEVNRASIWEGDYDDDDDESSHESDVPISLSQSPPLADEVAAACGVDLSPWMCVYNLDVIECGNGDTDSSSSSSLRLLEDISNVYQTGCIPFVMDWFDSQHKEQRWTGHLPLTCENSFARDQRSLCHGPPRRPVRSLEPAHSCSSVSFNRTRKYTFEALGESVCRSP